MKKLFILILLFWCGNLTAQLPPVTDTSYHWGYDSIHWSVDSNGVWIGMVITTNPPTIDSLYLSIGKLYVGNPNEPNTVLSSKHYTVSNKVLAQQAQSLINKIYLYKANAAKNKMLRSNNLIPENEMDNLIERLQENIESLMH